jgi:hypothetical protein
VIVNLAGWLYLVQAGLSLMGVLLQMRAFALLGFSYFLGSILISGFVGLIGFGLVNRRSWGHWLALGPSLIAGTLGLLGTILLIGAALFVFPGAGAIFQAFSSGQGILVTMVILLVFIVATALFSCIVNLKLFLYLIKEPAHDEFGVESDERGQRIFTSIGTWILVIMIGGFMTGGGSTARSALALMAAGAGSHDDDAQAQAQAQAREFAQLEARAVAQREELNRRDAELERAQHELEREMTEQSEAVTADPPADLPRETYAASPAASDTEPLETEAPAPVIGAAREEPEETSASTILKCRDKSGAVSYTQGYCPPGTTLVDKPRYE